MEFDIIIRNALLRGSNRPTDIGIASGKIAEIAPNLKGEARTEPKADGRLVSESFVIAHVHLDKAMTGSWVSEEAVRAYQHPSVNTRKAITIASKVKERYMVDEIVRRARSLLQQALCHGATHIRAFADVDTKAELKGVTALLKLREEFTDLIDLQVVAFPQEGIFKDLGAEEYLRKAMKLGADIVGGIPWTENDHEKQKKHIDTVFDIAKEYGKNIAMLVDDTANPSSRTLEILCHKTIQEKYEGRVQACHARALAVYDEEYAAKVIELVARAKVGVVTSPHTGPIHARPFDLMKRGAVVALGQDDCNDAYYSYGRCNMIEVAFLASHLLRAMTTTEMNMLFDMITVNPARIMGIESHRLEKEGNANLVILNANSIHETLRNLAEPRYIISHGRLVAENVLERRLIH